ncbi:DMT family transporter [Rhodobacteraceae bacterium RKSG542]|uniref:DMT family transporter n=1 Tax=Pseudovibrio flavus TaxID=2529854 RepID=UPI0012BD606A|nr:DMT family transporter [Pseudovibrio flavus]MTI16611.1 DMT family transporter [Pseudovibrio flavus]
MPQNKPTLQFWLLLSFLAFIWGGAFFLAKLSVSEVPPILLVFFRVSIAGVCLWMIVALRGSALGLTLAILPNFLVLGMLNNVIPFGLLFWGQQSIGAGLASVLNAFTPVFTMVLAQLFTSNEKLTPLKLGAAFLGVLGVAVMTGVDAFTGSSDTVLPQLACLGAALSYATAFIFIRRMANVPPLTLAIGQLTSSTLILLPIVLLGGDIAVATNISWEIWGAIAALAVISTALAYLIFFRLISMGGSTNTSLVTFLVPVSAILLGTAFLDERLALNQWTGIALIMLALLLIDGRIVDFLRTRVLRQS